MVETERRQQPRRRDRRNNDEGVYKEFDGDGYDEEDEHEWVDNKRRYGGRYRDVRNREDGLLSLEGMQGEILRGLKIEKIII